MSSHSILPNSASANHSAAQAAAMTSPSPSHSPVFGGGKIAGVVIAGAVVLILLAILLGMYIRRLHNRQQDDDDEYWCRGKPEDLERIPSHSQRTQSTELREMVHAQSALSPVLCSAGGSHRTERTLSPHSDSGYGPSPVSTIKSSHATARSFSLVRPTLVDLPAQRPVSRMSRLVSGQVVDSSAVRSTPSMSFTSELSTSLRSCPSGSTPLPRKSSSTSPIRPNAPAGLFLLPVSAASPDARPLSDDEPPMNPSNYIPIYFDRRITSPNPAPLVTSFQCRAPSAWTARSQMRPISECSGTTNDTTHAEIGPSSIAVHSVVRAAVPTTPTAPTAVAASPSVWNANNRRISTTSEISFETDFTDCSTDHDDDDEEEYAPALSPVGESPSSAMHSPTRPTTLRRVTVTRLPPVHARVAVRGPFVLPISPGR